MAVTERPRSVDIGYFPDRQGIGPDDPGTPRNKWYRDGDDHVLNLRSEDRNDSERHDDQRERHEHVHHPLEDKIESAAEIGAHHAEHQAQDRADKRRDEADEERCPRPID